MSWSTKRGRRGLGGTGVPLQAAQVVAHCTKQAEAEAEAVAVAAWAATTAL